MSLPPLCRIYMTYDFFPASRSQIPISLFIPGVKCLHNDGCTKEFRIKLINPAFVLHTFLVLHMWDPRFDWDFLGVKNVRTGSYAHLVSYSVGTFPAAALSWPVTFISYRVSELMEPYVCSCCMPSRHAEAHLYLYLLVSYCACLTLVRHDPRALVPSSYL
jgi:hypothetical protein